MRSLVVRVFVVALGEALLFWWCPSCVLCMAIRQRTSSPAFVTSFQLRAKPASGGAGPGVWAAGRLQAQRLLLMAAADDEVAESKGGLRKRADRAAETGLDSSTATAAPPTKKHPRRSSNRYRQQKAVVRIISSIEDILGKEELNDAYHNSVDTEQRARNRKLLEVLSNLPNATSRDAQEHLGRDLKRLALDRPFSVDIQERIMQIAALQQGLFRSVALPILYTLVSLPYVPSVRSYIAVLNRLRQESLVSELRSALVRLAAAACQLRKQQDSEEDSGWSTLSPPFRTSLDVVAYNIYLSALCDSALSRKAKENKKIAKYAIPEDGGDCDDDVASVYLQEALDSLQPGLAREKFCLSEDPNLTSFNTVLHAAVSFGNQTMANQVYQWMQTSGWGQGDIVTYNARLRLSAGQEQATPAARKQPMSPSNYVYGFRITTEATEDEDQAAAINEECTDNAAVRLIDEIMSNPSLTPDRYTIDLALVPLARAGRVEDIISLLSNFVRTTNEIRGNSGDGTDTFSAFLCRLVQANDVDTARVIFDLFLVDAEEKTLKDVNFTFPVATTRHFNILIEGYRRRAEVQLRKGHTTKDGLTLEQGLKGGENGPLQKIMELYELMIQMDIKPTAHTLTSMICVLPTSEAITSMWKRAQVEGDVPLTTVVGNALICAYGRVSDAASACYVFDQLGRAEPLDGSHYPKKRTAKPMGRRDHNSWDYLLSAFASGSSTNDQAVLNIFSAVAATRGATSNPPSPSRFLESLHGLTHMEAALWVLKVMKKDVVVTDTHLFPIFRPSSKTYCFVASAVSHARPSRGELGLQLFRNAVNEGIPADGRFVNAVLRCMGDDLKGALKVWKTEIRRAVVACDNLRQSKTRNPKSRDQRKNLLAAYDGLVFVCGRAGRPDAALRVAYAMKKEGLVLSDVLLNCYFAGKRLADRQTPDGLLAAAVGNQYESLLRMECSQFEPVATGNREESSRPKDATIRIIF